jgi:hypothetical protein
MRSRVPALCRFCFAPFLLQADVEEKQTIRKTLPAAQRLEVDSIWGSIRVSGYDGGEVQMTAIETIHADSPSKLADARRDVKLDISQQDGKTRFYVDGPFRDHCKDGSHGVHWDGNPGYEVKYEFEIKVPRHTTYELRTVNEGGIHVDGVSGDFEVHNVNGSIEMLNVAGSGTARTVNGGVTALFTANPRAASTFASINGAIDLAFQPDLAADFRIKTFNGGVFTDFDMTALPTRLVSNESSAGRQRFKADAYTSTRVGHGGPVVQIDGFNGEIRIHHAK